MMFLVIFSLVLIIANILCFIKKKYLYLFIPCMLFLPNYYGFDFSESFPIITVTRIMYIVFFVYTFVNRRRDIRIKNIDWKKIPKEYIFLGGYFVFRLITNLYYAVTYSEALKTLIAIIFEQLLLLVAIYLLAPTKEELTTLIKVTVWTATAMYLIGIFESYSGIRPFDYLYTVSRTVLNNYYIRLGFLRSTTSMGLPNFYGNMCMLFLPVTMYIYKATREKKYFISLFLNILAQIHSGCRSNLMFSFIIVIIYFIFVLSNRAERIQFIKSFSSFILCMLLVVGTLSIVDPYCRYFYVGTAKSMLNEVGFKFDLNEGAPEGIDGYGRNQKSGRTSRTSQFSSIGYVMDINPVFGLGSGAQARGQIMYFGMNKWRTITSYDMGIVQILCDEGILGLLGYIMLFVFIGIMLLSALKANAPHGKIMVLLIFTYILSTFSTVNMIDYLIVIVFVLILKNKQYISSL